MSVELEALKARFEEVHAEAYKHSTHVLRDKLAAALACADAHASLELNRGTVKYADAALAVDAKCVTAHLRKAQAYDALNKKKDARRAAEAGFAACDKVACLENLSEYRRQFAEMLQRLPEVKKSSKPSKPGDDAPATDAKSPAPKSASTDTSAAQAPAVSPSATDTVLPPCPPPAAVLRPISCWNTKGTWEEVDTTDWAVDHYAGLVENLVCSLPSSNSSSAKHGAAVVRGTMTLTSLQQASGHAQVVSFQGKVKYLFELSFELAWVADVVVMEAVSGGSTDSTDHANTAKTTANEGKRRRFKGVVHVSGIEQDLADGNDVIVEVPLAPNPNKWTTDPAMAAVKSLLEAPVSGTPSSTADRESGSAAAVTTSSSADETSRAERAESSKLQPYTSLRDLILARTQVFIAQFRQLGQGGGNQDHSTAASSGDNSKHSAARRSTRRRDLEADAAAHSAQEAAAKQEARRAATVADLKRTNPNLKIDI